MRRMLLVMGTIALALACGQDMPTRPRLEAGITALKVYEIHSVTLDSFYAFSLTHQDPNWPPYSTNWVGVPARIRSRCNAGTWSAWTLIAATGLKYITCPVPNYMMDFEIALNDSISTTSRRIVIDTGQSNRIRVEAYRGYDPDDPVVDTVKWPQWVATPYIMLQAAALRAEQRFTYARSGQANPMTPIHVCRLQFTPALCTISFYRKPTNAANDTVFLAVPVVSGIGPAWVNNWEDDVPFSPVPGIIVHEYGHAYHFTALHVNPDAASCHIDCVTPPVDLLESFATFFVGVTAGMRTWGQAAGTPGLMYDDWQHEDNGDLVALDPNFINLGIEEPTAAGLYHDMMDAAADSNAFENTTGEGAGVDDETVNWGPKYVADLTYGAGNGGTGAKCTLNWTSPGGAPETHVGVKDREDFLICALGTTGFDVNAILPAQWRSSWRLGSGWTLNSYTETITEPSGWTGAKMSQLWKYDLYHLGTLP